MSSPSTSASPPATLREASDRLVAHRLVQRGTPTWGDEEDAALLRVLRDIRPEVAAIEEARSSGARMGRFYAKAFLDAPLGEALELLCELLARSGISSVRVVSVFHREATLAVPAEPVVAGYVNGVAASYLESCFNCAAITRSTSAGRIDLALAPHPPCSGGGSP